MKLKFLFTVMTLLFLIGMAAVSAQTEKKDSIIVREGDWAYVLHKNANAHMYIERLDTKDRLMEGKHYYPNVVYDTSASHVRFLYSLFRSVFSKERAKELAGKGRLVCFVYNSPVENKIIHIRFLWGGLADGDNFPVTLKELGELERKFRTEPAFPVISISANSEIRDGSENCMVSVIFEKLFDEYDK